MKQYVIDQVRGSTDLEATADYRHHILVHKS